ncbi:hypothetical protein KAR91_09075 [Candidatus Pacearchaeota archaeon]|nr:hypothetical protein [Candidatus Pacearchaeota archaeon]
MSFFGALFKSGNMIDGVTDLVTKSAPAALDKMFHTDEEKADFRAKNGANFLEMTRIFMKENTSFALARRVLAIIAYSYYFPMCAAAAGLFFASVFVAPTTLEFNPLDLHWRMVGGAKYLKQMAWDQLPIIITITMFYFGPGVLDKLKGK